MYSKLNSKSKPFGNTHVLDRWHGMCYRPIRRMAVVFALMAATALGVGGCDAFNPAFVSLIDSTIENGTSGLSTLNNAPGHVVIAVVNRTTIQQDLRNFLSTRVDPDVQEQIDTLRPRMRLGLLVTFADGARQTIEFITGSRDLVDLSFAGQAETDLNQKEFTNAVILCDVRSVELDPNAAIEVFMPVRIVNFQRVDVITGSGVITNTQNQQRDQTIPGFRVLLPDDAVVARNIGARDIPGVLSNVQCGSVVVIEVSGQLFVPFADVVNVGNVPAVDLDAPEEIGSVGGRYEFRITVQ